MTTGRLLLTGASGFIGRPAVAEMARRGFEVHATAIPPLPPSGDLTWHAADLLDREQRRDLVVRVRPTHLLHLAWYVEHGEFWAAPENETWRDASLDLFDTFSESGGRRAVFVGSCAEYDWNRTDFVPWRESDPCRPSTPYGRAKHALHLAVEARAASAGVSLAWARLFLLFGDGEDRRRLVPSLIGALVEERTMALGSGRQIRDFSDTRDVAAALGALVAAEHVGGAVNVASGRGTSIAELARILAKLTSTTCERLRFGALPERNEPPAMVADITRLTHEVGFVAQESLEARLAGHVTRRLN